MTIAIKQTRTSFEHLYCVKSEMCLSRNILGVGDRRSRCYDLVEYIFGPTRNVFHEAKRIALEIVGG